MGQLITQWVLGGLVVFSSLGILLAKKPVHASLAFLLTLMSLAATYLELGAPFVSAMQILVYAGAILVIFMFVVVLFQDAYLQIGKSESSNSPLFLGAAGVIFLLTLLYVGWHSLNITAPPSGHLPPGYGDVETLGKLLYIDFFFPFEAVILIFLVAVMGALYIGKK